MASTLVPAIRARMPDAEITWAAGTSVASVLHMLDGIDRVVAVDDGALLAGNRVRAAFALVRAWAAIGRGYDRAIVAHTDARYALLARWCGASTVTQFAGALAPRRGRWHGDEYLRLLDANIESANAPLARIAMQGIVDGATIDGTGPLVVIAPGGGRNVLRDDALRRWPLASWVTLTQQLVARGHRVVAIGGAADAAEGAACAGVGAHDITGKTTTEALLAVMAQAAVVVTHDAGPMHLAILAGRPVVALFGPTRAVERIPSWANAVVLSRADTLACAPCYDGRNYADCALNLCLRRVEPTDVVSAVTHFTSRERR